MNMGKAVTAEECADNAYEAVSARLESASDQINSWTTELSTVDIEGVSLPVSVSTITQRDATMAEVALCLAKDQDALTIAFIAPSEEATMALAGGLIANA